jgi:hypothetical protein
LTCGSVDVLFTGDAEFSSKQSMLAAGLVKDIDVLKVGHHGSNSSTSLAFLQVALPEVAVISAGWNNQYGHPHPDVLSRLASVGASVVYTDTTPGDDSVVLTLDCQTYSFSSAPTVPGGTVTPSPTASVTATPGACGGATATITGLDKVAEIVTLTASGNLTGWKIVSLTGKPDVQFPFGVCRVRYASSEVWGGPVRQHRNVALVDRLERLEQLGRQRCRAVRVYS